MFVPFVSTPSVERRKLWRRKGGGGGGRGGGGGSRGGSTGSSGGSGIAAGRTSSVSTGVGSKSAKAYGNGGGPVSTIPAGAPFAGAAVGGGTRSNVYGSKQYNSGYPGVAGRAPTSAGFPFYFWPVSFGAVGLVGTGAYIHHNNYYGHPRNSSRPGGQLKVATFASNGAPQDTFRLLADGESVQTLVEAVKEKCSTYMSTPDVPVDEYDGADTEPPQPEQVVQYYRASSVALSLDSYNNTAVFEEDEGEDGQAAPDVPIDIADPSFMNCLNTTIGEAVPLIDGAAGALTAPSSMLIFGLAGMVGMFVAQL